MQQLFSNFRFELPEKWEAERKSSQIKISSQISHGCFLAPPPLPIETQSEGIANTRKLRKLRVGYLVSLVREETRQHSPAWLSK